MSTVLLVLKIIGITLLVICTLAIVLILCVLYMPIRYKAVSEVDLEQVDENDGKPFIDAKVKASWLFIIRCFIEYQKQVRVQLKILGITVFDSSKRKKKEKADLKEEKGDNQTESQPEQADESYARGRFCDKLKKIKEKKDAVINLWNDAQTVRCKNLITQEFLYLIKKIKPDMIQGYLHFGFDDPALTGYGMALYGIMIPIWGDFLRVEPEFEKQVLQANIKIKGKITGFPIVRVFLKLFYSEDLRCVIKKVKALK